MTTHFCLDIETLGTESTCVIISMAVVPFRLDIPVSVESLRRNYFYRHFDIQEQLALGRVRELDTIKWWSEQSKAARDSAFNPETVYRVSDALTEYATWLKSAGWVKNSIMWTRGALDMMAIESLHKSVNLKSIVPHYRNRDIRTFVDLVYGSRNGYTEIDTQKIIGYNENSLVAHNPVDDCIRDICMILGGKPQ